MRPIFLDLPFWSNLIQAKVPHPKTLRPFLKVLKELGITIPSGMVETLVADQQANEGNSEVIHKRTGAGYVRMEDINPGGNIGRAYDKYASIVLH